MAEKQVEAPKPAPEPQIEAFPSKEAHIEAALTKTINDVAAEQAKLEAEKPPEVEIKPVEKPKEPVEAAPKAKEASKPAPEPEKAPEVETEPKISALDRFKAAAAEESGKRQERQEVKEWKDKYAALEGEVSELRKLQEELRTDPLSFFEKRLPTDTYEQLTHLYAKGEKPSPESARFSALEKKLDAVMGELKSSREESGKTSQQTEINNYAREITAEINKPEYDICRKYAEEYKLLTGEETNFAQAGIQESIDFFEMTKDARGNGKRLTPTQVCEVLKEKAEENLARSRPEKPVAEKVPETKPAKKPAQTLTNDMESESDSHDDTIPFTGDRNEHIQKVIDHYDGKMFQGNPEK